MSNKDFVKISTDLSKAVAHIAIREKLVVSEVVPLLLALMMDQCIAIRGKEKSKQYLQDELNFVFAEVDKLFK